MIGQLERIHGLFTGALPMPAEMTKTEKAIDCYACAELADALGFYSDPLYEAGDVHLSEALTEGDLDAVRLAVYIHSGLSIKVRPEYEKLEGYLQQLLSSTGDMEIRRILEDDYAGRLEQFKRVRSDEFMQARLRVLMDQHGPGFMMCSYGPAYYEDED